MDKRLLLITLFAFIIRVYFVFFSGLPWYSTDTFDYLRQADGILAHHPISYFPNGYPLLIASVKLLFDDPIPVLAWLNVLFSTLTVTLTLEIARRIHTNALVAGLVVALYPNQLNYCRQLLSDTPTTFLLLLGVWFILTGKHFWAGLILYIAAMFRSTLLPILPAYLVTAWYFQSQIRSSVILALGALVGIVFHGILLLAETILPAANFGLNLLIAVGSHSNNLNHSIGMYSAEEQAHPLQTYLNFALRHPLTFIAQRLDSLWQLWGPWPAYARSLLAKPVIGLRFPLLLLGSIGAFKYRKTFHAWILFIPVIVITLGHTAFFSYPRYTLPVEPLLTILATTALCNLKNRVDRFAPGLCSTKKGTLRRI